MGDYNYSYKTKSDKREKQRDKRKKKSVKHGVGAWAPSFDNKPSKRVKKIISEKIKKNKRTK